MHASVIHVLERGRIVESGSSHDELVAQRGLYYAMWRQQNRRARERGGDREKKPGGPPGHAG